MVMPVEDKKKYLQGHDKSPAMVDMLKSMATYPEAWEGKLICCQCGGPAEEFKDELSMKEYRTSKWCQVCQDKFWG
jgi:hypothetical protein